MKRIPTSYLHTFNADATRRRPPCSGSMEMVSEPGRTYVCCSECCEGYRFEFVMREKRNGADA